MKKLVRTPAQLGVVISQKRQKLGLTQTQLAERMGMRQAMISQIERGHEGAKISIILDVLAALDAEIWVESRHAHSGFKIEDIF